ncbi:hypothetical protein [Spirochaeta isovalerica]|uniref:Uncharacterized protein n=1 Tax=Spirochaeta isovalerica TaxID=150 RepID=A0A841RAM9_9SPIO|nr:hypothetical protein [Spirochaeta isovalerica]MBB6480973.1 hypothetical protein [Spirochaeta isovalerica]
MKNTVKKGRGAAILIMALAFSLFLIDRLFLIENRTLHLAGTLAVLLFYSLVLRVSGKNHKHDIPVPLDEDSLSDDSSAPGVLIPVEDESDLGELIEVGGDVPEYNPFQPEIREDIYRLPVAVPYTPDSEPIEELEAFEEPVEELEPVDD